MVRKNYLYQVQIDNDNEVVGFNNIGSVVDYLNEKFKMPCFSRDILHGWFHNKHKRKNVMLQHLKLIQRIEQPNKLALKKERAKL